MFAALHNHSHFSLLDGVVSPEILAKQAARLDIPAIALTDHDAVYGAIPFAQACELVGINAIIGTEMTVANLTPSAHHHLTLLAMNRAGYALWRETLRATFAVKQFACRLHSIF